MAGLRAWIGAGAAAFLQAAAVAAQEPERQPEPAAAEEPAAEGGAAAQEPAEPNPDEMADLLNSRQQIKQSFTFTRTINGEVVETDQRTVTYSRKDPLRGTEAGESPLNALKEAFDSEVLTRTEAFEEARLDFVIADKNRDNLMTAEEFAALLETWRETGAHAANAPDEETARQRQYRAFVEELDPEGAKEDAETRAGQKFLSMAGASQTVSREDYLREYLLDFDSMDADGDGLLKSEELMLFRALNRGETVETQAEQSEADRVR